MRRQNIKDFRRTVARNFRGSHKIKEERKRATSDTENETEGKMEEYKRNRKGEKTWRNLNMSGKRW
jgi:hypothetical protein